MNVRKGWRVWGGTLAILVACTVLAALMRPHFDSAGLTMVYLLGVVVTAIAFGRGPAIAASVLSVALFDFAFVPPRFTFRVSDAQYLVVFAVMLAVAVVIGTLTARLREQREGALQSERRTAALYRLAHELAAKRNPREVLQVAADRITDLFSLRASALIPDGRGTLTVIAGEEAVVENKEDRAAAEWAYANGQAAGILSGIPSGARGLHLPLLAGTRILGVLSLEWTPGVADQAERMDLLRALTGQTAFALERCRLAEDARLAQTQVDAERARNALLSSVSHDLRTPLAAITGAASSLRAHEDSLSAATRQELAESISEEADRLNRLIGNLLEMTRIDSGSLRVKKDWHSIEEIIGAALARLEVSLAGRTVHVSLPTNLPLVPADEVLLEVVIQNLIENAHKYSPNGEPIEIGARVAGSAFLLEVADRGGGLASGDERRVFEKFYRGESSRALPGAGLGLSICRGIVEAHGGSIEAAARAGGGAMFTLFLPLEGGPPRGERERPEAEGLREES